MVGKGADSVLGTADKFISATDKQLQEQLKQLHVTLLNLKVVTTYAKELVETWPKNQIVSFSAANLSRSHPNQTSSKARSLFRHETVVVAALAVRGF